MLIDTEGISKILKRLSFEIIEANPSLENIAIVGIRTRGDVIAKRIADASKAWVHDVANIDFIKENFSSNILLHFFV